MFLTAQLMAMISGVRTCVNVCDLQSSRAATAASAGTISAGNVGVFFSFQSVPVLKFDPTV